jgi:hypothetical protein
MSLEALEDEDGFDAFFSSINPEAAAEEDTAKKTKEAAEEATEAAAEEPADTTETTSEASEDPSETDDEDEREVTWKQGDAENKAKLKELKAAFAERSVVAQRAREIEQARVQAASGHQRAHAALNEMLQRAEKAFEPYSKLNMFALAKDPNIDAQTLQQLQSDAQAAFANVQYLKTELDANLQAAQHNAQAAQREASVAAVKALMDPKTGIEGFGKQLWGDIHDFAVKQGIPSQTVQALTDPAAIKLIHKAMLYDKQKAAAAAAAEKVVVAKAQPKRTMKASSTTQTTQAPRQDAMRSLRRTGSIEDATDAFAASLR